MVEPYSIRYLMRIYEQNYRLLLRLVPEIDTVEGGDISDADGSIKLHLFVLERNTYTVTLRLTYLFLKTDGSTSACPDLTIRVYHDARVAEVYLLNKHGTVDKSQFGISQGDSEVAARCKINAFLEKWLACCVAGGHRFVSDSLTPDIRLGINTK